MFEIKPNLEIPALQCPNCASPLAATDFIITGMRNLADTRCANCGGEFFADLPAGQALYTPITLDKKTGATRGGDGAKWFADWLSNAYKNRSGEKIGFETRKYSPPKDKVILLNCLDVLYGHSLLKLLNAQRYIDFQTDFSLILIVQPFLEWLIPDGTAEAWIVDLPLRRGAEWNEPLAAEIKNQLERFAEINLSVAFSHPPSADFDIERFTLIAPLPLENFAAAPQNPVVTFIWREDRLWTSENKTANNFQKIKRRFANGANNLDEQTRRVTEFAERLRGVFPALDFAVAGLGKTNDFPFWIKDLRLTKLDEKSERAWCERYANSHLVVGVHGSNMLLPSAHAGGVIEIIGAERLGNYLQDILLRRGGDAREMFFRYRFVSPDSAPENLAEIAATIFRCEDFRRLMNPEFWRREIK